MNGVYPNLGVEFGDAFKNSDCRCILSRADGRNLREVSVAEAFELADEWIEDA